MTCPNCGSEYSQDLGIAQPTEKHAYRCATCGFLYAHEEGIAEIVERLNAMRARAELMAQEHHRLLESIADLQRKLASKSLRQS